MNKEVIYKDGVVTVKDAYGNEREVNNLDNLDEILIQENVIETILNTMESLEFSSETFSKNKFRDLLFMPTPIIGTVTVPTLMTYITSILDKTHIEGIINTRFGPMKTEKFLSLFIAVFLPFGYRMSKKWYNEYKEESKRENGRQLALEHLRTNLIVQRAKLMRLDGKGILTEVSEDKSYFIDDDEILETLHDHICLYYDLGYNSKEYYEYYKAHGELPEELKQEYNEAGRQMIETLLQERGPNLVKRGNKSKKKRH